ncbi:hypothetical protein CRG98_029259 [Punica granatum]|uniref:G-patch domain-containing protein n=1 Tax=Punica granatum TaxID=22663 RepID=A0A2I0J353_PUNGR|nr:hypothetical protein CRG98_029259 [Punica granatum]
MIGKVLLRHNYIPGTGLGARGQGISRPIEIEEYKHRRGLGFRPSCHEIIEARRGNHLHRLATHYGRLNRGIPVPPLSHFFPGPPLIIGITSDGSSSNFDDTTDALPTVYAVIEEIPSVVHIRPAQENEELNNWTSVLRYSAVIADVLHLNPNLRHVDSNPPEECLGEPGPIYFGEGLDEDSLVPEIEESLHRLKDHQLTSLEPTEEINVGTEEEPRILKIGTSLDPTQRVRMIDFLTRYQEVFAWSYADMPGLDPSIVKHFLQLDTEKFPPKWQQLRRQRASFLLRIKEEVVKQINAGFLEVRNYSEWVANIAPVEKKDGRADPLKYLLDSPSSTQNLAKWRCQLREYDIEYMSRTSVKGQAIADHLAEFPIEDRTLINPDFPDEGILQVNDEGEKPGWKMYFDGAVNSAGSGIGAVLISLDGRYYPVAAKIDFPCTNKVAEYEASFNARVRHRDFSPGDLVLRKVLHVTPDSRGNFSYKYDGPFVVKEVFSGGAVILSDTDGTENALPVNADAIKKYYP